MLFGRAGGTGASGLWALQGNFSLPRPLPLGPSSYATDSNAMYLCMLCYVLLAVGSTGWRGRDPLRRGKRGPPA